MPRKCSSPQIQTSAVLWSAQRNLQSPGAREVRFRTQRNGVPGSTIPFPKAPGFSRSSRENVMHGSPGMIQVSQDSKCPVVCQIYVKEHAFHSPLNDVVKHKRFCFSRSFTLTLPLSRVGLEAPDSPYLTLNGSIMQ